MGVWLKALRCQKSKREIKFNEIKILQVKKKIQPDRHKRFHKI